MSSNSETHVRRGHPITFGVLLLFTIIEVAISTWLVNTYNKHNNYPTGSVRDRTRFLLFTSWWTFVFASLYLIGFQVASNSALTSIASHGTWIFLTWIFWLAGAAAITQAVGGASFDCGRTAFDHCSQLKALEGFAWVNWIIMTFMLAMIALLAFRGVKRGDRLSGGVASSA